MAEEVIGVLPRAYGATTIVYVGECGIDHSFSLACSKFGLKWTLSGWITPKRAIAGSRIKRCSVVERALA